MTIELHKECRSRVSELLETALRELRVRNGQFIDRGSSRSLLRTDTALPQSGEVHESLLKYVGETPGYDFTYETLARELLEGHQYVAEDAPRALDSVAGYADLSSVAGRLVEALERLPREYLLTIPLPNSIGSPLINALGPFAFSSVLKLVRVDDELRSRQPLDEGRAGQSFRALLRPGWGDTTAALQIGVTGFVGIYGHSAPLEEAIATLRSFLGLGIALRLFKVERTFRGTSPGVGGFVHREESSGWALDRDVGLEAATSEGLLDLVPDDLDGKINTPELQTALAARVAVQLECVFRDPSKAARIVLGGQWLFDSHSAADELLAFVQAAVVLEIILGDKAASEAVGLGELLRNRCAYLIGKTRSEREGILDDFQKIYDVRSRIVHTGKRRLNRQERILLFRLQWLCNRVVQEEVDLLKADADKAGAERR
jgi:hypothetical protein